jgi:hypothetical protein
VPGIEDKDVPIKIDKDVVKRTSGVHRPRRGQTRCSGRLATSFL